MSFFACCQLVAENVKEYDFGHAKFADGEHWNTKEKVAIQVKVALHFVDPNKTVVINNQVHFEYRSLSFENLHHMEACYFFDRAFELLGARIGMSADELVHNAKERMQNRR